jgi:hypothetical protein
MTCEIRTHDPSFRASEDSAWLTSLDYRDQQFSKVPSKVYKRLKWLNKPSLIYHIQFDWIRCGISCAFTYRRMNEWTWNKHNTFIFLLSPRVIPSFNFPSTLCLQFPSSRRQCPEHTYYRISTCMLAFLFFISSVSGASDYSVIFPIFFLPFFQYGIPSLSSILLISCHWRSNVLAAMHIHLSKNVYTLQ